MQGPLTNQLLALSVNTTAAMKLFLAVSSLILPGALAQPFRGQHKRGGFDGGKIAPFDKHHGNADGSAFDEDWMKELLGDDNGFVAEHGETGHHHGAHHHGPFPGPRHHHRPHPFFPDFDPRKYMTNITCPVADDAPDCRPLAPHPFEEKKAGTWVCRTMYNPITGEVQKHHSVCVDDRHALITDKCGCCDPEGCPKPCSCSCGEDGHGVLVDITPPKNDDEMDKSEGTTFTKCVPSELAISAIAMTDRVQCHASCDQD